MFKVLFEYHRNGTSNKSETDGLSYWRTYASLGLNEWIVASIHTIELPNTYVKHNLAPIFMRQQQIANQRMTRINGVFDS